MKQPAQLLVLATIAALTVVEGLPSQDAGLLPTSGTHEDRRDRNKLPDAFGNQAPMNLSGDLLPERLPEGDPVHYALPVFLEEPKDDFVMKSKEAELTCKVAHALNVHFQCNDEVQEAVTTENHVNPESGISYTEARLKVSRDQVEEYFGDYHCACVAVSGKGAAKSSLALVTSAFLKKEFETPPYSQEAQEGRQVELRCHPPRGKPEPKVYWEKDNKVIDETKDKNFIVTTEGHLIIVSARQSDTGNYTCVAENIANIRKSRPAELHVFGAGGSWSSWSSWSPCSSSCGKGMKKRVRTCHSASLTDLSACPGSNVQKKTCEVSCPDAGLVNGDWSTWGGWSSCSNECVKLRRRKCNNPPPSKGGHYCFGVDYDSAPCTGGKCSKSVWVEPRRENGAAPPTVDSSGGGEMALYIGLGVALLVFLLVVLVAVVLLIRKRQPDGYTLTPSAYEAQQRKKVLGYSPDLTSGVNTDLASVCYEYSCPYPNNNYNHSKNMLRKSDDEHHYEQPMVIMPSSRSPVDSMVKPLISETSSSSLGDGDTSPRSGDPGDLMCSPTAVHHPTSILDPKFTRWTSVTHAGARIKVPNSNVVLTVPEGAVAPGQTQDMFVSVVSDSKSAPRLEPGQTLLSPLVVCGPSQASLKLKKPVILSLPHSASLRHGNWSVSVVQSDWGSELSWQKVVTLGQETINTPVYAQLDLNTCHIITDSLAGFTLLGQSAQSGCASKSLRVAAFGPQQFTQGPDLTVRVYCVQDTDEALKHVTEIEKQFGGKLLDKPVSVIFQDGGENLKLKLDRVSEGWGTQPGTEQLEVPFSHIWSYSNPGLHCSFSLHPSGLSQRRLCLHVLISQDKNSNKGLLKVNTDISVNSSKLDTHKSTSSSSSTESSSTARPFRLPASTKDTLSRMLDSPVSGGNDWRMLAERLNVHRYITFFATRPSPTEAVLDLWEARNRETNAIVGLVNILRGMGRFDAVHLLEHDLQVY